MKTIKIKRNLYFHELELNFTQDFQMEYENHITTFFETISQVISSKSGIRYLKLADKSLMAQDISIDNSSKQIRGKIFSIRTDILPVMVDISTDVVRDLEALESEGLAESNHFLIDYSGKK